ncbi:MAG: GNAT family N-acetyltransferase [Saonia sp.]
MKIQNSTLQDIDEIFRLYRIATDFQRISFPQNVWPEFDRDLIETEIHEHRQWKLMINDTIACIWAITFYDPQIWQERNKDPSIYMHRIATNPDFRGQKFVSEIVEWAKGYAISRNKSFIRMDTCGDNKKLIAHYESSGFNFLGMSKLKNTEGLPSHYENADVCLFEIELNK